MRDEQPSSAHRQTAAVRRRTIGDVLHDGLSSLAYFRWPVLVAFLLPTALGVAAGLRSQPVYLAQARMLVLYAGDYVFHPGDHGTGNDITLDRNQIMQAELGILQSPALAAQTVAAVGPDRLYPGLDPGGPDKVRVAAERFATDFTVTSVPQSNIVELSLRGESRDVAIETLGELILHYLPYRSSVFEKSQTEKAGEERAQFAGRLRAAEDAMTAFGLAHGITNLDEQTSLLLHQRTDNGQEQSQVAQLAAEAGAKLEAVRAQLPTIPPTVQLFTESTRSQQVSGLTDSLVKLTGQRQELRTRYRDDAPAVRDIERQIAAARQQIAASAPRDGAANRVGRNIVYDDLKNQEAALSIQLRGLEARRQALAAQGRTLSARSEELVAATQPYRELQRSRDVLDQSFRSISRSSEEAQLSNALERAAGANVRVVQPPDAPLRGRSQRSFLIAGGLVAGVLFAAASFAVLNLLRRVAIGPRDVERDVELPVLMSVSLQRAAWRSGSAAHRGADAGLSTASYAVPRGGP